MVIHELESALENYDDTCNLTASCDLVISVVTAVVHLAGALGVKTFCLTPKGAAWKFTPDEVLPWHASVVQLHQAEFNKWDDVLARLKERFDQWLETNRCTR